MINVKLLSISIRVLVLVYLILSTSPGQAILGILGMLSSLPGLANVLLFWGVCLLVSMAIQYGRGRGKR